MKRELSREFHSYTSGEWINKRDVPLSSWPVSRKSKHTGRVNAGGRNRAMALLRRLEKDGRK